MRQRELKRMCLAGVMTAVVFVFTAYLHIPSHTGYTHVGDGFLYLAACLLPFRYAALVGAGGALLADCLTGFAIWAPASVVIKAASVLFFTDRGTILSRRNLTALIPAGLLCVGGYYLYESLLTGNFTAPLAGIPGYAPQTVLSALLYLILGAALDRMDIKKKINGGES